MSQVIAFGQPIGQGWTQVADFGVALVLSGAIGLEREIRQKAAGLRTYTIVGLGSALFMLISKYGFTDILSPDRVVLDPSRVAAQIVSGLGFIGGGVIFVRRDIVRGLTTAASVWLTAAVGAAAGADLPILAVMATVAYFLVSYAIRPLAQWAVPSLSAAPITFRITYLEGRGLLRDLLNACTDAGFTIAELTTVATSSGHDDATTAERAADRDQGQRRPQESEHAGTDATVEVLVSIQGRGDYRHLTARLAATPGVLAVSTTPADE